jgi:hypothetical protein
MIARLRPLSFLAALGCLIFSVANYCGADDPADWPPEVIENDRTPIDQAHSAMQQTIVNGLVQEGKPLDESNFDWKRIDQEMEEYVRTRGRSLYKGTCLAEAEQQADPLLIKEGDLKAVYECYESGWKRLASHFRPVPRLDDDQFVSQDIAPRRVMLGDPFEVHYEYWIPFEIDDRAFMRSRSLLESAKNLDAIIQTLEADDQYHNELLELRSMAEKLRGHATAIYIRQCVRANIQWKCRYPSCILGTKL